MTLAGLSIPLEEIARRTGLSRGTVARLVEPRRAGRIEREGLFALADVAMMLDVSEARVRGAAERRPWLGTVWVGKRRYYTEDAVTALRAVLCPAEEGRVAVVRLARRAGHSSLQARRVANRMWLGLHAGPYAMLHLTPAEWAQVEPHLGHGESRMGRAPTARTSVGPARVARHAPGAARVSR